MSKNVPMLEQARAQGEYAAAKELRRLRIDQSQQVDIFGIIENAGIWLFFSPLKDVQGAFLRDADTGQKAILINSRRPLSMQRLTAAHEYGHYILGHAASLDDLSDVESPQTRILQEAAAQVFANDFMMPPQLVERIWRDLSLPQQGSHMEPHQVYLLSLHLGVSYTALIFQLVALRKVSRQLANQLAKYQPRRIKQELLGRDLGPVDSWADVWPIDENDNGHLLNVRVNDEINVALPETPSSGFRWIITAPDTVDLATEASSANNKAAISTLIDAHELSEANLVLLGDEFEGERQTENNIVLGAGGRRYLKFRVMQPGAYELRLDLCRPWMGNSEDTFHIRINAVPKATGDQDKGVRDSFKEPLAQSAALHDQE